MDVVKVCNCNWKSHAEGGKDATQRVARHAEGGKDATQRVARDPHRGWHGNGRRDWIPAGM